jgi:tRNA-binding EMAP/Myf-like protein
MPVRAMKVSSKTAHDKTDQLFIYTFESPAQGELTIVANLTNVYEPGDVVAVALLGTMLPEGEIKPRKVFGIPSSGMALGPVQAELDADLTEAFGADKPARPHVVLVEVEVEGCYPADVEAAARKAIGKGEGSVRGLTAR